ncbi:JHE-like carboxylesterase 2, partial [Penaeus vannamei]
MPVMVWLHGGGFLVGGSEEQYPPMPLLKRDVVLVVPQYRLGTLGFLSTEDEALPGNLGLKDQTLALRWVKENIRALGGDPFRLVLFSRISYLNRALISSRSSSLTLFNRIITPDNCTSYSSHPEHASLCSPEHRPAIVHSSPPSFCSHRPVQPCHSPVRQRPQSVGVEVRPQKECSCGGGAAFGCAGVDSSSPADLNSTALLDCLRELPFEQLAVIP